ncbi:uncharacterized protein TNCV_2593791 [Trichonephila clavipes]|nr:uncharacterized protein TNCV_2593791 [Trichonephila clavipes]
MNAVGVNCDQTQSEICSSKQLVDTKVHQISNVSMNKFFNASFDVNMRIEQGILSLGLGYSSLEKFCMHMNLSIKSSKTFNSCKAKVLNGHLVGSNQLLLDVRKNIRDAYGSKNYKDIVDIGVSYDGSWLTRGHTSNIGVGCDIDLLSGFVIDYEVMSKRCGECEQTKFAFEEDSAEFRIWYEGHQDVCSATHVGSSGAIKENAAVKLWERSESIGFQYTTLLHDGDSKSFLELKERNVYRSETQIKKEECINHVSKWLGTALRHTVKDWRVKV